MDNSYSDNPYILEETNNFAVVYKPPKMHCTPGEYSYTLLDWYTANTSRVFDIMHRLDYETHGLVLFARNENSFTFFKNLQNNGEFIKEYSAICKQSDSQTANGFPELVINNHGGHGVPRSKEESCSFELHDTQCPPWLNNLPYVIESYFRPYGPGRKLVRPVIDINKKHKEIVKDKDGYYRTEIININDNIFTVQIKRGFRHQIRCHLCWIGYPILNDPLYSSEIANTQSEPPVNNLALRSHALFFTDPASGEPKEYRINALNIKP
ncbi:MAG: pseudouridine synthase [Treponema sp.]|nr:pseudouridine synthase [Treponema sp.]